MKQEEYDSLLTGLFNIIFTNDICTSYIYDTIEIVEKADYCKQAVKYRMKLLQNELKAYNRVIASILKEQDFIADINEYYADIIRTDLMRLELTVKNYMNKCHVPEAEMQTKLAISYIFAKGACHNVDQNIKRRESLSRYMKNYRLLRLTRIEEALQLFADCIATCFSRYKYHCDLNNNDDVYNGFVIICRKLADPKNIRKVIDQYDKENGN